MNDLSKKIEFINDLLKDFKKFAESKLNQEHENLPTDHFEFLHEALNEFENAVESESGPAPTPDLENGPKPTDNPDYIPADSDLGWPDKEVGVVQPVRVVCKNNLVVEEDETADDKETDDFPETAEEIVDILENIIDEGYDQFPDYDIKVKNFRETGLLTRDKGLVLTLGDKEFQITVVRSK